MGGRDLVIRPKLRPGRIVLRRINEPAMLSRDILATNSVDEVVRILNQLPEINGAGHRGLEVVSRLTPNDMTEVMRVLKVANPGAADIIKKLGFWFPRDDKHHVRHAFLCLASAIAASEVKKLHQL